MATPLELGVGAMTTVLIFREARAMYREGRQSRNGTGLNAAIEKLTEAITAKELKDTERFGTVVGHIKDSERRLADRISESRK